MAAVKSSESYTPVQYAVSKPVIFKSEPFVQDVNYFKHRLSAFSSELEINGKNTDWSTVNKNRLPKLKMSQPSGPARGKFQEYLQLGLVSGKYEIKIFNKKHRQKGCGKIKCKKTQRIKNYGHLQRLEPDSKGSDTSGNPSHAQSLANKIQNWMYAGMLVKKAVPPDC